MLAGAGTAGMLGAVDVVVVAAFWAVGPDACAADPPAATAAADADDAEDTAPIHDGMPLLANDAVVANDVVDTAAVVVTGSSTTGSSTTGYARVSATVSTVPVVVAAFLSDVVSSSASHASSVAA